MTNRRLTLRRETLSTLESADLGVVAAGASGPSCYGTCLDPRCHVIIDWGPSIKPTCQHTLCEVCTT